MFNEHIDDIMEPLRATLSIIYKRTSRAVNTLPRWTSDEAVQPLKTPTKKIESYSEGYPQFSSLISARVEFFIFRRFRRLRARVLLAKQDKLSLLEEELDNIDEQESRPLFLGKLRGDPNQARRDILCQVEAILRDYGTL